MANERVSFRNFHLVIGGLGLLIFVLQGQYMTHALGVEHLPDAPRMMYRSAHIYLLLACVANVSVGYYLIPSTAVNYLQRLIGVILLCVRIVRPPESLLKRYSTSRAWQIMSGSIWPMEERCSLRKR